MVKLTINDRGVEVPEGTSVLDAARKVGVSIPTLCHYEAIKPYGGCRLCLVEITAGHRTFRTASCTYPVAEGIKVVTDSDLVLKRRRMVLDLLWSRCPEVPVLAKLAQQLGLKEPSFIKGKDDCILCGLCTRMCAELQGPAAIGFMGRGAKRQVLTPFGEFSQVCRTCGACAFVCPTGHIKEIAKISGKTPKPKYDEFNAGMQTRGNIFRLYPQAVPATPAIDRSTCIQYLTGECGACEKFCPADAIDYQQQDVRETLEVGSVIMATGFQAFDPSVIPLLHYRKFPNVVTALEFERILSASGPFAGHLVRPSDHKEPEKIAWLQCVGSRDVKYHSYCSGVCCMYAIKEAVIAKEHSKEPLDTAIFFMDMRTYGKDFEQYYNRAQDEYGVRFIRSRIHSLEPAADDRIQIAYADESGERQSEVFDMVVLSVGLEVSTDSKELAQRLGVEVNEHHFARTEPFTPIATSKEGVYVCGVMQSPKDIPFAVMEASAAAAASCANLSAARYTQTRTKEVPPERTDLGDAPRIGVFVCNCGINIGGIINVPEVAEYSCTLPNVVYVDTQLFTCSQDTQVKLIEAIAEHRLNRLVVAACTPLTHEALFRETMRDAGLNKYLFEMANIRNQDSWVHMQEPEKATEKAKDLVRMAVFRAGLLRPLMEQPLTINPRALVIGGGVAGLSAALNLADQGFETIILEKEKELGGFARKVGHTIEGVDVNTHVDSLITRVQDHEKIAVLTQALVVNHTGYKGNFVTEVLVGPGMYERKIEHGVTVVATGAVEYRPTEFLYGQDDRVMTQIELGQLMHDQPDK
ncbi:MAG: FAD-dependent oxidoreductase, partial [Deltaproteobacteria bacterium]|nr:FAD-dependent oxidoreductase [Deltaproteobacteria bacterium]